MSRRGNGFLRLGIWAGFAAVISILSAGIGLAEEDYATSLGLIVLDEAIEAPEFTLPSLDGGEASLSDFKGKVVLLNFWATW